MKKCEILQQLPQGLDKQLVKDAGKSGKVATVWTEQITCAKTKQRQLARNEADEISQTNQGLVCSSRGW